MTAGYDDKTKIDVGKSVLKHYRLHRLRLQMIDQNGVDVHMRQQSEKVLHEVAEVLDTIPMSKGKLMCEWRYIYDLSIPDICDKFHISRSSFYRQTDEILKKIGDVVLK